MVDLSLNRAIFACGVAVFALAQVGCTSLTQRADEDRLSVLRSSGLEAEVEARQEERLTKVLSAENATGALADRFGSLSFTDQIDLTTLMATALDVNPTIGSAAEGINRAEAERLNAIMGYLPQVSANLQRDELDQEVVETDNAVFEEGSASYPVDTDRIQLTQPIFDLSRFWGIRIANTARTQAEIDYVKAVKDVMADVFDQYVIAVQSAERAEYLQSRLGLMDRQLGGLEDKIEFGEGQYVDLASMRSERGTLAAEIAFEQTRYQNALSALSALTGTVIGGGVEKRLPSLATNHHRVSLDQALALGREENPAIMSAAISVVASNQEKWQARFDDFAPVLNAYASLEREDREDSRFGGGSETDDQTVGLQLSIPIFNARGRGYSSLTRTIDERVAALEYYTIRNEVETSIRGAYERMDALQLALGASDTAVRDARSALQREEDRVELGQSEGNGVLAREIRLNVAEERQAFYRAEYLRAWGELQYLTGGSLNESVE